MDKNNKIILKNKVFEFLLRNLTVTCVFFFIILFSHYSTKEDILNDFKTDTYIYTSVLLGYLLMSELTIFIDRRYDQNFYLRLRNNRKISINKYYAITVLYIVSILIYVIILFDYFVEFRVTSLITVFSAIYIFMFDLILITRNYYKRLRSEKIKNAQLREVKLESDLKVLQSQINPHFLFNSLNVLVSEIYFDQERAVSYIQHLSDIYRYVLQSTQKNLVDIETELDFLHSYIYMFKTKYDDGFQVKIDIANDLLHRKIPPLALQILVENSIKHNAILPGQPLIIKIYTTDNELIISNNINKKNNVSSELTGLKNLNTRYKILANKSIIINSNETEFKVALPLL